jgi:hypothetical protein
LSRPREKIQDGYGEARSEEPYLKELNLPTPPLMPGGRSRRRSKGQRSIIIDDVISINIEAKKDGYQTLI